MSTRLRYQGRPDDNLISLSLVVTDMEFGDALKLYVEGLTVAGRSTELYLDAAQAEELGNSMLDWAIKLRKIAEMRLPHEIRAEEIRNEAR